jgi:hypothetical protein
MFRTNICSQGNCVHSGIPKRLTRLLHTYYLNVIQQKLQHLKIDMVFQLTTFDVSIDGMAKGFYGVFCVPTQRHCV